jgi:hypothetical protein
VYPWASNEDERGFWYSQKPETPAQRGCFRGLSRSICRRKGAEYLFDQGGNKSRRCQPSRAAASPWNVNIHALAYGAPGVPSGCFTPDQSTFSRVGQIPVTDVQDAVTPASRGVGVLYAPPLYHHGKCIYCNILHVVVPDREWRLHMMDRRMDDQRCGLTDGRWKNLLPGGKRNAERGIPIMIVTHAPEHPG